MVEVGAPLEVTVIEDPRAAEVSLDPVRTRLLAELAEPASAAGLAARLGLPRQKVNYHLRTLEQHGLVELVEERRKGNTTERVMRARAASYVISPAALSGVAPDPADSPDQLSARWLLAIAARVVTDVGTLISRAAKARKKLATFTIDAEVRFATAADRAAFARDLAETVAILTSKYHSRATDGAREHRLLVAVYPKITDNGSEQSQ
jgi:DNA-binding transcriptional ArsR family regulator